MTPVMWAILTVLLLVGGYFVRRRIILNAPANVRPQVLPSALSGLAWWLKADAGLTTPVNNTEYGGTWVDQSANAFTMIPPGGYEPLYLSAQYNGKPTLRIADGNDDMFLQQANFDLQGAGDDLHMFLVVNLRGTNGTDGMLMDHHSANGSGGPAIVQDGANNNKFQLQWRSGGVTQTDAPKFQFSSAQLLIMEIKKESTTVSMAQDGGTFTSGTVASGTMDNAATYCKLGGCGENFTQNVSMDLSEIVYSRTVLTSTERTGLINYLKLKYAIA